MSALEVILDDTEHLKSEFSKLDAIHQIYATWQLSWLGKAYKHQIEPAGDWWDIWLMLAGRGAGKGLTLDTPIPTPIGWVLNGDLKDGDAIFDERGNVCHVVKAHDPYEPKKLYRITFNDNSVIEADGDHLWTTMTHRTRKQMTRNGIKRVPDDWPNYLQPLIDCHHNVVGAVGADTLNTSEILNTLTHGSRKDFNHCIPTTQPLNLPELNLPVDPYLLGSWLGDGASKDQCIYGHVDDIGLVWRHAVMLGYDTSIKKDGTNTYSVRIQGLMKQLRPLNLLNNKHIPSIYLRASVDQRLALLRGLMDTDGYQDSKAAEFCNTNKSLAEGVFELAISLGEKPVIKESRAMLYGKDCGAKWRVTWRWNRFNPFLMERKADRLKAPEAQGFKHGHRMIVSVEEIPQRKVRCITVDSHSRLYLAGRSMIPTHNTRSSAETLAAWAWENPGTRWLVSAPTSGDLRGTCFEGDSGLLNVIPKELISDYNKSLHEIKLINGSFIKGIPASEPERFRGPQFHGGWLDELAAWDYAQESWDMIQFGMRLGKKPKLIISTTPKPKPLIISLIGREGDDVTVTRASTYANKDNLAPSFLKQILQYEGTKLGQQEIHAELIDPEAGGIVKREWFRLWPNGRPFPKLEFIIQSYDCATSDKTINDPTGSITLGVFKPLDGGMSVIILDCWQEHLQYPDLRPKVISEYEVVYGEGRDRKLVDLLLVEDKSAGISLIQDLQRAHLPVHAYNPGKADKVQRLSIVANIIKAGRVWVPESGKSPGFVRDWAEGMVSQICSFPEGCEHDEFVDCFVAGTLIRMADGSKKRIEKMMAGDMVATPFGPKPVVSAWRSGVYPVTKVSAGDRSLIGTPNHQFMANDDWTAIDKLNPLEHTVYFYQGEDKWPLNQQEFVSRASRSMDTNTTGIQTLNRKHIVTTIQGQVNSFIKRCGSFTMGLFLLGTKYTIWMDLTTTSVILCASQLKNTGQNTVTYTNPISNLPTLKELEERHQNGTNLMKVQNGIRNMLSSALQKLMNLFVRTDTSRSHIHVAGVGLKDLRTTPERSSVQHDVNLPSQASALVKQVQNTHTMQAVFNLEVADVHCYFANDILVHNCISQGLRYLRDAGWISIDAQPREEIEQEDITDADIYNSRHRGNPYSQ